ncbi:MAG: glutamate-1-semialdehyde 2,1-aminomutase [Bryobacteraceae bacterium]|nr:glutamate-1-semialdehyde 2,1-aminomutase [Bryobacteraceae bacterium]
MIHTTTDRYAGSRALLERARQSLAGGVSSPFRAKFPVPLFLQDGEGPKVRDVDGNEYIDYTLAWGPLILGHKHPRLVAILREQAAKPHIFGAQHELEYQVAELIQSLVPCAERVVFTSSGSEAVQCALRLARAYTSRNKILKFEGYYHGWLDSVLLSHHPSAAEMGPPEHPHVVLGSQGQTPNSADNVLVARWNDLECVEKLFAEQGDFIAAVITEPVLCNSGCILPEPGYLEGLRKLTQEYGALLIFHEIIAGFRIAPGGAQAVYKVTPDLATFGKALAGGLTLSAFAGRREILEQMAEGRVAFGGTFNGNSFSLAAALATLDEISRDGGRLLQHANHTGRRLMQALAETAAEAGVPLSVTGFGAAFSLHFGPNQIHRDYRDYLLDDRESLRRFLHAMLDRGIYSLPDGRFYVSAAHGEAEVAETVQAARSVFHSQEWKAGEGKLTTDER